MTLPLLVAAWLVGLMLGFRWDVDPLPLFLLASAALPLAVLLRLLGRAWWPPLLVMALLLGMARVAAFDPHSPPLIAQDAREVSLRGRVDGDPEATGQRIKFVLAVAQLDRGDGWQDVRGRALVYAEPPPYFVEELVRRPPYFRYGDVLLLEGAWQLPQPVDDFDYPAYLDSQGISGVVWPRRVEWLSQEEGIRWLGRVYSLRHRLADSLELSLPAPHAELAQALLLGLREQLPDSLVDDFRRTGVSHLLAISGLHVGVLLALSLGGSTALAGRRHRVYLLLPLALLWLYALVSGLPPSVVRAAIMGSVYLVALALGRPNSALPALALGAAVMTALDPLLLERIAFQLSFAAVAGIILALPCQARLSAAITEGAAPATGWMTLWPRYLMGWVASALVVSVVATLATLPLVALNFQAIPILGIPTTILALPALPFVLLGSMAAALAGLVHPLLGVVAGWVAWAPLSYLLGLVSWPAEGLTRTLPGDWVDAPLVWGWYLALGGLLLLPRRWSRLLGWLRGSWPGPGRPAGGPARAAAPDGPTLMVLGVTLALAASGIALWVQLLGGPDGRLHVHFFDVGQGDSFLVVTPGGRQVLIDGGPELDSATRALGRVLPFTDRSLDLVVLTHIDADHVRGLLDTLERYRVEAVLAGSVDQESPFYPRWRAALDRAGPELLQVAAGYSLALDQDLYLQVLHPPAPREGRAFSQRNNNGVVLRLVYRNMSILFTADIEAEAEGYLAAQGRTIASRVLKAAHHGSKTSTTSGFLKRVDPSVAVISAGAANAYGHPHPEVLARLTEAVGPSRVYQTAACGDIEFISDGHGLWVKTDRPGCRPGE